MSGSMREGLGEVAMDGLVEAWIRYHEVGLKQGTNAAALRTHPDRDADSAVTELVRASPLAAISFMQLVLNKTDNEELLAVLAAGPLEDVLVRHGPEVIDEVERTATQNQRFRELLFGVWRNAIDATTWQRVERLRQLGIPPAHAELVADQVDWHAIRDLVARGCAPALALRIVR